MRTIQHGLLSILTWLYYSSVGNSITLLFQAFLTQVYNYRFFITEIFCKIHQLLNWKHELTIHIPRLFEPLPQMLAVSTNPTDHMMFLFKSYSNPSFERSYLSPDFRIAINQILPFPQVYGIYNNKCMKQQQKTKCPSMKACINKV